ncbi:TonB-dependent receptor plug domain-containing protein [Ralstonia sp. GX3-BWBA]|uniref:TonB-dependent receptor plug domain-containing protein n=1 Tax=Ralstonia sp. GX3-BWBA TaxID=2219865 RepID=UPI001EF93195|nr:TonB-dependent receptor plug domain-containing protein [Ralstonia sp. GX3-BWBA]
MNCRTPVASALLALFATPTVALAQQATLAQAPATATLPEAVVKGSAPRDDYNAAKSSISKLPENLRDVPQSVTVVPKALTDAQGGSSLADALRNVPGITIGAADVERNESVTALAAW